jgi:16S rRNA (uracil1498-N3)-methyltransferase
MPRFYINQTLHISEEIIIPLNIVQHLNVLRLKAATVITLFNGDGYSYTAKIIYLEKKSGTLIITHKQESRHRNKTNLHLGLSIIANDKMDLALRNATELGARTITPLISTYAQKLPSERLNTRMEHWRKVILSSCEQCGQNNLPIINNPTLFTDFIVADLSASKQPKLTPTKFILTLKHNDSRVTLQSLRGFEQITLLVGPVGGFTAMEVDLATANSYIPLSPWHNILRTETAVAAGISLILNNL